METSVAMRQCTLLRINSILQKHKSRSVRVVAYSNKKKLQEYIIWAAARLRCKRAKIYIVLSDRPFYICNLYRIDALRTTTVVVNLLIKCLKTLLFSLIYACIIYRVYNSFFSTADEMWLSGVWDYVVKWFNEQFKLSATWSVFYRRTQLSSLAE